MALTLAISVFYLFYATRLPFALLALTVVLSAQGAVLITALQATGNTKPLLKILLASTILDLAIVALAARTLGTTAGAAGRIILATSTLLLAWQSLRPIIHTPVSQGIYKALLLAAGTAFPLCPRRPVHDPHPHLHTHHATASDPRHLCGQFPSRQP